MFSVDIEKATIENINYRKVLHTTPNQQLVVMSILPYEDIPQEIHPNIDQFIRVEGGKGEVRIGKNEENIINIEDGSSVIVKQGTWHRVVNTSNEALKLYTIYSPPEHPEHLIQKRQKQTKQQTNKEDINMLLLFI